MGKVEGNGEKERVRKRRESDVIVRKKKGSSPSNHFSSQ